MMQKIRLTLLFYSLFIATVLAQTQDKVDFLKGSILIEIQPTTKKIIGTVVYEFEVLNAVDSVFLDAKNMSFKAVKLNAKKVKYHTTNERIIIAKKFKKGEKYSLTLNYTTIPKQTVYFIGWDAATEHGQNQIWTQGQGKYTSYWLPSFDDMTEKVEFDMSIIFDEKYEVISNGTLVKTEKQQANLQKWTFDMQNPMSSYLVAFAIGNYKTVAQTSTSQIPLNLYFYPEDSLKVEPTYRYTKQIFDFLEDEIGVAYPWQNYKQIPVKDFLYAGMENTGATIFSDAYMIDSTAFIDKNYVNVNAHELAHQWFGNLVTEVDGNSHWLHEGFATYYALLAEKEIFGDDYFYWKLFDSAEQLKLAAENGQGEALQNDKASSLTFYEKGAWALVMLRNEIGDKAFKNGIKTYLENYKFKNVTIKDFIIEMEKASEKSLANYQSEWLTNKEFPIENVKEFLSAKAISLASYYQLKAQLDSNSNDHSKKEIFTKTFLETSSSALRKQIIQTTPQEQLSDTVFKQVLASDDVLTRQGLIINTTKIPQHLKSQFETLMNDNSYVTIENALLKLWYNFPEDRKKYMETTKDIIGLPDYNVRLLWLTLALVTENYNSLKTKEYFDELGSYTSPTYSPEIRQKALLYLHQTLGLTDEHLKNLINASMHHSWQFKKFARALIDDVLKDEDYKNRITALLPMLNSEEQRYIKSKL
ncbi:M1 family metallopeptidase [Cellulophaga tyrosinoxydans]|nr:M1 family metallopeptidase [Cellulophaga tyrosinoxydans]